MVKVKPLRKNNNHAFSSKSDMKTTNTGTNISIPTKTNKIPSNDKDNTEYDNQTKRILKVKELMIQREDARKNRNFALSDTLRDQLNKMQVEVIDQKDGPSGWKFLDGSSKKLPSGVTVTIPKESSDTHTSNNKDTTSVQSNNRKTQQDEIKSKKPSNDKRDIKPVTIAEQLRNKDLLANLNKSKIPVGAKVVEGITIEDIKVGSGQKVVSGNRVKVFYTGWLKSNNRKFDSSNGKPFQFRVNCGEVIRGWDIGVQGMQVSGKRKLTIPPEKAYGKQGAPPTIPPNSTLIFDVELLQIM